MLRKVELYLHSPIRLHDVVLNWLSTGTTLPFLHRRNREALPIEIDGAAVYYVQLVFLRKEAKQEEIVLYEVEQKALNFAFSSVGKQKLGSLKQRYSTFFVRVPQIDFLFNFVPPKFWVYNSSYT
jgi:hypothetical protein